VFASSEVQVVEFVGATRIIQSAQVVRLSRKALARALQWGTYFEQASPFRASCAEKRGSFSHSDAFAALQRVN
jgi:4-alpha-glucanotransferase